MNRAVLPQAWPDGTSLGGVSGYTAALFITGLAFAYKLLIVVENLVPVSPPSLEANP